MGKASCRLAIEFYDIFILHAKRTQKLGNHDTADGIHGIDSHFEVGTADRIRIDKRQREHCIDMTPVICRVGIHLSEALDRCEAVTAFCRYTQHFLSLGIIEKFATFVQKLEGIPLARVVRCGQDKTSACFFTCHGKLCCRSGSKIYVDHIKAHSHKRAYYQVAHHFSGYACVAAYDNSAACKSGGIVDESCERGGELHNVERRQRIAGLSAYCSADT